MISLSAWNASCLADALLQVPMGMLEHKSDVHDV